MHSSRKQISMTLRGNDALWYMQTPPRLLFDGWSERTKLYPGNTLSKCPSGHPILHQGLKLNSKISAEKYEKNKFTGPVDLLTGSEAKIMFKICRDSIKRVVILARIQSGREASHYLTLMDNCKSFYPHVFFFA